MQITLAKIKKSVWLVNIQMLLTLQMKEELCESAFNMSVA